MNMKRETKILFVISAAAMLQCGATAAAANDSPELQGHPERRNIFFDKHERTLYSENSHHGKSGKSAVDKHNINHSKSSKESSSSSKSSKKYSSKASKASRQSKSYKSPPSSKASKVQKGGDHTGNSSRSGYTTNFPTNETQVPTPSPEKTQFPVYDIDFDDFDFVPTFFPTQDPTNSPTVSHAPTVSYVPTTETMSPTGDDDGQSGSDDAFGNPCTRVEQIRCCRRRPSSAFNAAQLCRRFGCDLNRCPARPRSLMDVDELEYYYDIDRPSATSNNDSGKASSPNNGVHDNIEERVLYSNESSSSKSSKPVTKQRYHSKSSKGTSKGTGSKSVKLVEAYSSKASKVSRHSKASKSSSKTSKSFKSSSKGGKSWTGYATPFPTPSAITRFPVYDIDFGDFDFVPTFFPTQDPTEMPTTSAPTLSPSASAEPTISSVPTTETGSPTTVVRPPAPRPAPIPRPPTPTPPFGCTRVEQIRCCRRRPSSAFNAAQLCRRFGCDLNRCPARPRSLMDVDELEYYYDTDGF